MAMQPRETIYAALFALLNALTTGGSPAFKKASRTLLPEDQVAAEDMPALFVLQVEETPTLVREIPAKWTLSVDVFIYASTTTLESGSTPSSILNPLVDAVIAVLVPPTQGQPFEQTLGNLVSKCRVAGKVAYGEGVTGNYSVVRIPIEITVPQ
jgi:hypothetical protein